MKNKQNLFITNVQELMKSKKAKLKSRANPYTKK